MDSLISCFIHYEHSVIVVNTTQFHAINVILLFKYTDRMSHTFPIQFIIKFTLTDSPEMRIWHADMIDHLLTNSGANRLMFVCLFVFLRNAKTKSSSFKQIVQCCARQHSLIMLIPGPSDVMAACRRLSYWRTGVR